MAGTIKAVIFDWAGTVIDFGSCAPVDAMKQAFAAEQVSVTDAIVRRHMGRAKRDHINAILSESEVAAAWTDAHGSEVGEAGVDRIFAALEPLMIDAAAAHALLIPGAADTVAGLRDQKIRIGSCTGYTRAMMAPVQSRAAQQGYAPDVLVCADDTVEGRPSPLMVWKNLVELGVWMPKLAWPKGAAPAASLWVSQHRAISWHSTLKPIRRSLATTAKHVLLRFATDCLQRERTT
jgi:phosphonoacetaldehyde hydrolase